MTQQQLAEALGVEPITVSRWERGVTSPSLPRLRRVAEVTGTSVGDLVRNADPAATALAAELAALREELAETRELADRLARALERLTLPPDLPPARCQRRETSDVDSGQALDVGASRPAKRP